MEKSQERAILGAFAQFLKDVVEAGCRFVGSIVQTRLPGGQSVQVIDVEPAAMDRKAAARYIGVGVTKFDELRRDGEFAPVQIGNSPMYLREDLDRYLAQTRRQSKNR